MKHSQTFMDLVLHEQQVLKSRRRRNDARFSSFDITRRLDLRLSSLLWLM